jgi:transketolase
MRRAFAETLSELATRDPRIVLLTADLGFMALEPFSAAHPDRFFNVGVAEQNMVGVATGMAEAGFIPFVYSIVNFATLRPFEFIRNGPVAHRLPVRIVSVGGGLEYGHNGLTHFGLEDVALLRTQPGLKLVCPCDPAQARAAIQATWNLPGPVYYRLGKDDRLVVPGLDGRFKMDGAEVLHEGGDALMLALGPMALEAVQAARKLKEQGLGCQVLAVSSFEGAPGLIEQMRRFAHVFTVEGHYITGALGSWAAELIAENRLPCRLVRCGVRVLPDGRSGSQNSLQQLHGFSSGALVEAVLQARRPEAAT